MVGRERGHRQEGGREPLGLIAPTLSVKIPDPGGVRTVPFVPYATRWRLRRLPQPTGQSARAALPGRVARRLPGNLDRARRRSHPHDLDTVRRILVDARGEDGAVIR